MIPKALIRTGASESSVSGESDGLGCGRGTLCHNKVTCSYKSMSQAVKVIHQLFYRGERFQKEFYNLGKVRSLIPKSVKMMAISSLHKQEKRYARSWE